MNFSQFRHLAEMTRCELRELLEHGETTLGVVHDGVDLAGQTDFRVSAVRVRDMGRGRRRLSFGATAILPPADAVDTEDEDDTEEDEDADHVEDGDTEGNVTSVTGNDNEDEKLTFSLNLSDEGD